MRGHNTTINLTTFASYYRVNTDGVENLFSQIKWIIRPKKLGSLVFEQALRDWLLGAGKHIPIVKACSVQAVQEEEDPFHFSVYEMEKKEDPFFHSITEDLVMPENKQEESLTVDLQSLVAVVAVTVLVVIIVLSIIIAPSSL